MYHGQCIDRDQLAHPHFACTSVNGADECCSRAFCLKLISKSALSAMKHILEVKFKENARLLYLNAVLCLLDACMESVCIGVLV